MFLDKNSGWPLCFECVNNSAGEIKKVCTDFQKNVQTLMASPAFCFLDPMQTKEGMQTDSQAHRARVQVPAEDSWPGQFIYLWKPSKWPK